LPISNETVSKNNSTEKCPLSEEKMKKTSEKRLE
jgi:hypothetical protein